MPYNTILLFADKKLHFLSSNFNHDFSDELIWNNESIAQYFTSYNLPINFQGLILVASYVKTALLD